MNFITDKCTLCDNEHLIESSYKICSECARNIAREIDNHRHYLAGIPILESNRGKWYFNFDFQHYETSVAFTPIAHWEKENCFCEYHYLSEEDQEYLDYAVDGGLMDELNYELLTSVEEARKKYLDLGMIELILD